MTIVVDASMVVAAMVDDGSHGAWADRILSGGRLAAPHHMPIDVANILRRAGLSGDLSPDTATLAHADLMALDVDLFPYAVVAARTWELRDNVSPYDGCWRSCWMPNWPRSTAGWPACPGRSAASGCPGDGSRPSSAPAASRSTSLSRAGSRQTPPRGAPGRIRTCGARSAPVGRPPSPRLAGLAGALRGSVLGPHLAAVDRPPGGGRSPPIRGAPADDSRCR